MVLSRPTVIVLLGPPAAGKRTVGLELVELGGPGVVLLDNHRISNPILAVIGADGATPIQPQVWSHARRVKEVVLEAAVELSPPEFSFVFTNFLTDGPDAEPSFARLASFATAGTASSSPSSSSAVPGELARRVGGADRRAHSKVTDPDLLRLTLRRQLFVPDHPNVLKLSTEDPEPSEVARQVLDYAATRAI